MGKILQVNLSTGETRAQRLDDMLYRTFLAGSGLVQGLLPQNPAWVGIAPDAPDNPLIFMAGLLTGTPVPTADKLSVCTNSPLTGLWTESTVGGYLGMKLKAAGWDGIILTGQAATPVYLWLDNDRAELRPAAHLWGQDTYETDAHLKAETTAGVCTATIGPAGENGVRFAAIIIGGHEARAAGRTGVGWVMGVKRLKGIAINGTGKVNIKNRELLLPLVREQGPAIREKAKGISEYGTAGAVPNIEAFGDLPIQNWRGGSWEAGAAKTNGRVIRETIWERHYACFACPIHCGKEVRVESETGTATVAHGPEYETTAGFGALCLNDDLATIVAANDRCNRLGLDTISTSSLIAFAMEAYEKGHLTPADTGGLDLTWGNAQAILALLPQIAYRQGLGDLLADGVRRAAQRLGHNSQEYAVHVKGLEMPYHDPRAFTSMAVGYATANRGGCHLETLSYFLESGALPGSAVGFNKPFDIHGVENKAEIAVLMQNFMSIFNPLGLCKFLMRGGVNPTMIAEWVNQVTGWGVTGDELMATGERLFNLARRQSVRLGISRKDDLLPPRLLTLGRPSGKAAGVIPHLGQLLSDYYARRGWSEEGIPQQVV